MLVQFSASCAPLPDSWVNDTVLMDFLPVADTRLATYSIPILPFFLIKKAHVLLRCELQYTQENGSLPQTQTCPKPKLVTQVFFSVFGLRSKPLLPEGTKKNAKSFCKMYVLDKKRYMAKEKCSHSLLALECDFVKT